MNIILLTNSTLCQGSVYLGGELRCLAINLIYVSLLIIDYGNTSLWFNKSTESIWHFVP